MSGPGATMRAKGARLVDQLRRDRLPAYTEARGDCDPLDVARLLAFCGDEEAHEIADWSKGEAAWDTWPEALRDLAAKLPPKRNTPAERWLMAVAAEAVARECVPACPCDVPRMDCCTCGQREIVDALDACRAWIAEPTPERVPDSSDWTGQVPSWVLGIVQAIRHGATEHAVSALLAAADVLGPDRVREIASRAIREEVRG